MSQRAEALRFEGRADCAAVPGTPLFSLRGRCAEGELQLTFHAPLPPGMPATLQAPCVEMLPEGCRISEAGGRQWLVAAREIHVHRALTSFHQVLIPRSPPWHRRLLWSLLLGLAGHPAGRALLRRLRGR